MNPSPFSHIKDRDLQAVLQAHPEVYGVSTEKLQERVQAQTRSYQEALSQLRLDMKYLIFDLEATRRERDDALQEDPEDE